MKQFYLWMIAMMASFSLHAQVTLEGSHYRQNFDSLITGLPPGWSAVTEISASNVLGTTAPFAATPATATSWANSSGGFKNMASANAFPSFAAGTTAKQTTATDRALGLKQTTKFGDPGAAFLFQVAQTYGLSDFMLSFRLQSLDSSGGGRSTEWQVEYALGYTPDTFLVVPATGTLITGNHQFRNELIHADFGHLLDSSSVPVWIRIVTRNASTGSGSRTATAVDDVALDWTGDALTEPRPLLLSRTPGNGATDVDTNAVIALAFSRNVERGSGNFYISNETDSSTYVLNASDTAIDYTSNLITLPPGLLSAGKTYHIIYDSTVADTSGFNCFSSYDSTTWHFSAIARPLTTTSSAINMYQPDCFIAGFPEDGKITVSITAMKPGPAILSLYGINGVRLAQSELHLFAGQQQATLHIPSLSPGLYTLSLQQGTSMCIMKCISGTKETRGHK